MDAHPLRGAVQSTPGYAYHATSIDAAFDILTDGGLTTHLPWHGTDQSAWPDGGTERRAYFTRDAGVAWHFAPLHGRPVLLRTREDAHPFIVESTGDLFTRRKVSVDLLEMLAVDGNWYPLAAFFPKG